MIWLVVGMSIFCNRPMTEIVNLMDITDRTGEPFTARSSVIQRRKTAKPSADLPDGMVSVAIRRSG